MSILSLFVYEMVNLLNSRITIEDKIVIKVVFQDGNFAFETFEINLLFTFVQ